MRCSCKTEHIGSLGAKHQSLTRSQPFIIPIFRCMHVRPPTTEVMARHSRVISPVYRDNAVEAGSSSGSWFWSTNRCLWQANLSRGRNWSQYRRSLTTICGNSAARAFPQTDKLFNDSFGFIFLTPAVLRSFGGGDSGSCMETLFKRNPPLTDVGRRTFEVRFNTTVRRTSTE